MNNKVNSAFDVQHGDDLQILRVNTVSKHLYDFPGGHFCIFQTCLSSTVAWSRSQAMPATLLNPIGFYYFLWRKTLTVSDTSKWLLVFKSSNRTALTCKIGGSNEPCNKHFVTFNCLILASLVLILVLKEV